MEPLDLLDNGNIPRQRKSQCCQVAFYTSLVLLVISALAAVVFCLLYHKQALESCWAHGSIDESYSSSPGGIMRWEWNLEHCDGFVQKAQDQYLLIKQSGRYFIYAQVNRKEATKEAFTLMLCKEPGIILNKAVGPNMTNSGTVNFGRPFFLQKGDKLFCRVNIEFHAILGRNQTYWGLYKM